MNLVVASSNNNEDTVTTDIIAPIPKEYMIDPTTTFIELSKDMPDPTTIPTAAKNTGKAQLREAIA